MNVKELTEFVKRESNVLIGDMAVLREVTPNGAEYITVKTQAGTILFQFWNKPGEEDKDKKEKKRPGRTGGRRSFVMLMCDELERVVKEGIKGRTEALGAMMILALNVEWDTGRLIHKRSKRPLHIEDMMDMLDVSRSKAYSLIKDLKDMGMIIQRDKTYYVSEQMMRKGTSKAKLKEK